MEHFYEQLDGWFTYPKLYQMLVDTAVDGGKIAEVGVWKGKSVCYIGVLIKNSNKNIKVYAIDTWQKMNSENYHSDDIFEDDKLYNTFLKTIEPISDIILPKRGTSLEVCKQFPDNYFDAVFIDACHDYECIKEDIINWLPKVKYNGILSGHDISFPGVAKATKEILEPKYKINIQEECWWINLK